MMRRWKNVAETLCATCRYWQNTRENQIKDLMHTAFPRRKVELLPLDMQELLDMTEEERQKKEKYDSEMKECVTTRPAWPDSMPR